MKTIQELNAYLYALSLVNSIHDGGFYYRFRISEINRCETIIESLIEFEKYSVDFEGYDKYEYELRQFPDGFNDLKLRLSELFLEYSFWIIQICKLDSDAPRVEMMREELCHSIKENLLSKEFVDSLIAIVGEDSHIFSVSVKAQESETSWSVLDFVWGEAFLIWSNKSAFLLEVSGID